MPSLNPTAAAWPETTRSFPKTGKRGAPQAFAHKLVQLLADEPDDIVAWSEDGTAFSIIDMRRFVSEVLPRHFSAAKFSSFQRQLNLYHFTTSTPPPDEAVSSCAKTYSHEHFLRDRPDLLSSVRRLPQASRGTRSYAPRASADGGGRRAAAASRRQAARSNDDDDTSSDEEYRPTNGGARGSSASMSGTTRLSSTRTRKVSARFAADAPSSSSSEDGSDDDAGVTAATMSSSTRGPVRKKGRSVSAPPASNIPTAAPSAAAVAAARFSSKIAHCGTATAAAATAATDTHHHHTHSRSLSAPPGAPAALTVEDEARVSIELSQLDLDHEIGLEELAVEEGFCYQLRRIGEEGDDDDDDDGDNDDNDDNINPEDEAVDVDGADAEQRFERKITIDGQDTARTIDDDALLAAAADAVLGIDCEDAADASSAMPPPPAWPRSCGSSARRQSSVGSECAMLRSASVGSEHWSSVAMLEEGDGADGSIAGCRDEAAAAIAIAMALGSPPALTDLATVFAPRTTAALPAPAPALVTAC